MGGDTQPKIILKFLDKLGRRYSTYQLSEKFGIYRIFIRLLNHFKVKGERKETEQKKRNTFHSFYMREIPQSIFTNKILKQTLFIWERYLKTFLLIKCLNKLFLYERDTSISFWEEILNQKFFRPFREEILNLNYPTGWFLGGDTQPKITWNF